MKSGGFHAKWAKDQWSYFFILKHKVLIIDFALPVPLPTRGQEFIF